MAQESLQRKREEYGVIYLTERLAALLERELDALDGQMLPDAVQADIGPLFGELLHGFHRVLLLLIL